LSTTCFQSFSARAPRFAPKSSSLMRQAPQRSQSCCKYSPAGEESAALTFDHLPALPRAFVAFNLGRNCRRRAEHQILLAGLRVSLPPTPVDNALEAKMRRFFMRSRIVTFWCISRASLQSIPRCVTFLARCAVGDGHSPRTLCQRHLERIHRDEARHVAIASRCATPLLKSARGERFAIDTRERLINVLDCGRSLTRCRSTRTGCLRGCKAALDFRRANDG